MKDQAADKRSPIIAGALILTAVFLVAFGWLLVSAPMPSGCLSGLWLDRLACLAPNELGDTFAGAFAPVAFVWLVAAVMLQRNELAAQRQELRESRAVAAQQVEEAKNNVALISQQTEMLKRESVRTEQGAVDEDINELMKLFRREATDILQGFIVTHGKADNENLHQARNAARFHLLGTQDNFDFLQNILRGVPGILDFCRRVVEKSDGDLRVLHLGDLTSSLPILQKIEALVPHASSPMAANFERIRLSPTIRQLEELIEYLRANGQPFR